MNKIDALQERILVAQTVERIIRNDLAVQKHFDASRTLHTVLKYVEQVQVEATIEETQVLFDMEKRAGQPAERSEHE